jgi:hypothetical protein
LKFRELTLKKILYKKNFKKKPRVFPQILTWFYPSLFFSLIFLTQIGVDPESVGPSFKISNTPLNHYGISSLLLKQVFAWSLSTLLISQLESFIRKHYHFLRKFTIWME